ncbi:MAG: uroporphyrinogen decarboxylase [Kiritimatiellia bacterium]|jgi:uroporphyrinogen decarboxylase
MHTKTTLPENDRFLKACRNEAADCTPIWLMRQAGRYMPEYMALREKHTILEMIRSPELASEVTLQPIQAFDLDAAIIFADILTLLDELGLGLRFIGGEGPVFDRPIRTLDDVKRIEPRPPGESLAYTMDAIGQTLIKLENRVPLIGFSGAPYTLACYAIEGKGSRDFLQAKKIMYTDPMLWESLMGLLADQVADYLIAQIDAGVHAVQLFDSWAGSLSPQDYVQHVLPYSRRVYEKVKAYSDVPFIHFATGSAGILKHIHEAAGTVTGVDWRIRINEARDLLGTHVPVQGNMDPLVLLGSETEIKRQARAIIDAVDGGSGHIFNLGHGIHKTTPPANVKILVDFVHEYSLKP